MRLPFSFVSYLPFEVGDRKPSTIKESDVLDADKLPSFFAQVIQVILNVFNYGLAAPFKAV
jgi:hypothetical protein